MASSTVTVIPKSGREIDYPFGLKSFGCNVVVSLASIQQLKEFKTRKFNSDGVQIDVIKRDQLITLLHNGVRLFYVFDNTSVEAADDTNFTVVVPNDRVYEAGRWLCETVVTAETNTATISQEDLDSILQTINESVGV